MFLALSQMRHHHPFTTFMHVVISAKWTQHHVHHQAHAAPVLHHSKHLHSALAPPTIATLTPRSLHMHWHFSRSGPPVLRWAQIQYFWTWKRLKWKYINKDVSKNTAVTTPQSSHGLQELASSIFRYSTTMLVPAQQAVCTMTYPWRLESSTHATFTHPLILISTSSPSERKTNW